MPKANAFQCDNDCGTAALTKEHCPDGWWNLTTYGPFKQWFFCSYSCLVDRTSNTDLAADFLELAKRGK